MEKKATTTLSPGDMHLIRRRGYTLWAIQDVIFRGCLDVWHWALEHGIEISAGRYQDRWGVDHCSLSRLDGMRRMANRPGGMGSLWKPMERVGDSRCEHKLWISSFVGIWSCSYPRIIFRAMPVYSERMQGITGVHTWNWFHPLLWHTSLLGGTDLTGFTVSMLCALHTVHLLDVDVSQKLTGTNY